jgi:aminoglycoside 6'-N-acetyltransferase
VAPDALPEIAFRPVTPADLPLLRVWLARPHVAAWWGEADHELGLIVEHLGTDRMDCDLILLAGRPVGYIQSYPTGVWPGDLFADQPPGSRGVDLFLGETAALGHGSRVLGAYLERLAAAGVRRVLIDPDPANRRAVRAYEKAGFRAFGRVDEGEDAPALLMRWEPD